MNLAILVENVRKIHSIFLAHIIFLLFIQSSNTGTHEIVDLYLMDVPKFANYISISYSYLLLSKKELLWAIDNYYFKF